MVLCLFYVCKALRKLAFEKCYINKVNYYCNINYVSVLVFFMFDTSGSPLLMILFT